MRKLLVHARLDVGRVDYSVSDMDRQAKTWGFDGYFEVCARTAGVSPS